MMMWSGIQGHVMYIDENGDAEANYTVVALVTSNEDEDVVDDEMVINEDENDEYDEYGKNLQSVAHFVKHGDGLPVSFSNNSRSACCTHQSRHGALF